MHKKMLSKAKDGTLTSRKMGKDGNIVGEN
jgi:hypothetical protein